MGPAPYYCEAEGSRAAHGVAERPNTAPARAGNLASEGQAAPQANPRRSAFWERESGQGMKSVLSHDVYFQGDQAQPRRGTSHQEGFRAQPVCRPSPAPSTSSTRPGTATPGERPAQGPPPQPKYPWSWEWLDKPYIAAGWLSTVQARLDSLAEASWWQQQVSCIAGQVGIVSVGLGSTTVSGKQGLGVSIKRFW